MFIAPLLLAAFVAHAQDGAKEKFAQARKQNAAQLRQYGWTSRTELKLRGETKKVKVENVKVENVRYDANGQLQKTVVESTSPTQDQVGGPVKRRIVEKKTEKFKESLEGLGQLAQSYAHMKQNQMQALVQSAEVSRGQGQMEGTVQIQGSSVVVPGDRVTLWVDPNTYLTRQVKIDSVYQSDPVNLTISYESLPQGPTYPAQVDLEYPKKEIQVLVQNSNYQRR